MERTRLAVNHFLFDWVVPASLQVRFSRTTILYVFYGAFSTLIDWSTFAILNLWLGFHYAIAATASFLLATASNFTTNKYLNFENTSPRVFSQIGFHIAVGLGGLGLTNLMLYILIGKFGWPSMPAKIAGSFLLLFYSYPAHKHITFNHERFLPSAKK